MEVTQPSKGMIYSREVKFNGDCPYVEDILQRINQQTGIEATYLPDKWLLVNSSNPQDLFSFYQDGTDTIVLTHELPTSDLLEATLHTLLEMNGYCTDWTLSESTN